MKAICITTAALCCGGLASGCASGGDSAIGGEPLAQSTVERLTIALERETEAAALLGARSTLEPGRIRAVTAEVLPLLVEARDQVALIGDADAKIVALRPALDQAVAVAELVATETESDVKLRVDEVLAHDSVALGLTNLSLADRGEGPLVVGQGRTLAATDFSVPADYTASIALDHLTFPSALATIDGEVYVGEAGYSYGNVQAEARVLKLGRDGTVGIVASGFRPPLAGVAIDVKTGTMFVSHRGTITRVDLGTGAKTDIVTDLPSEGDHFNEGVAVGLDGRVYFTQGTATNSGIVGLDDYALGWLGARPEVHDLPCRDFQLRGVNVRTGNVLSGDPRDIVATGAYQPFGTPSRPGQWVTANAKCHGAIFSVTANGSDLRMVADGFRNPYGIAFDAQGRLFVTENGFDTRGSRPVEGPDNVYVVQAGGWYGWPDFSGGVPVNDPSRAPLRGPIAQPLLLTRIEPAGPPLAQLERHASADGIALTRNDMFAPIGTAFVAEFGDLAPFTSGGGQVAAGHKVVRVEIDGTARDFLRPAAGSEPLLRPVAVAFGQTGETLYVAHFGDVRTVPGAVLPVAGTGALIRVVRMTPVP
jgi:glucose/arabinose dehydrogenase